MANIYQKLLSIQKHVDSFVKNKKAFNFSYVDGNQVLSEIRPLMNDAGLLLKQEVTSIHNTQTEYTTSKGIKSEILSSVMMRFTWIDCETGEKDECLFGANGMNDFDKGVGSALTYAERYFLLKYFHIPTDKDDVDSIERDVVIDNRPWLNKGTKEFTAAVTKLSAGTTTMEKIKAAMRVSKSVESELINLSKNQNATN